MPNLICIFIIFILLILISLVVLIIILILIILTINIKQDVLNGRAASGIESGTFSLGGFPESPGAEQHLATRENLRLRQCQYIRNIQNKISKIKKKTIFLQNIFNIKQLSKIYQEFHNISFKKYWKYNNIYSSKKSKILRIFEQNQRKKKQILLFYLDIWPYLYLSRIYLYF